MDVKLKEGFNRDWNRYFPGAELPIGFFYGNAPEPKSQVKPAKNHRCIFADLIKVRSGKTASFNVDTIGCGGGKRYLGFTGIARPDLPYFLSCGIPGKLEGERYKKSPALVKDLMKMQKPFKAPGEYISFKRWDHMDEEDNPLVVIFFATPDVLAGLFTLANFDESQPEGVFSPFGSGCASIVEYPYKELKSSDPRCILGSFDVSARPYIPSSALSFAVPWPKFTRMAENMKESFLTTKSWNKIRTRLKKDNSQRT